MSLMLFKYALPVVIGYVLYVGISGQLWPLRTPHQLAHRPAWFLGLWAGSAVALTLMLALNMAYHLPSLTVENLAIPSLSLLATAIIPGFLVFLWYRRHINQELVLVHRADHAEQFTQAEIARFNERVTTGTEKLDQFDSTWSESFDEIDPMEDTLMQENTSVQIDAVKTMETQIQAASHTETDTNSQRRHDDTFNAAFDSAYAQTRESLCSEQSDAEQHKPEASSLMENLSPPANTVTQEELEERLLAREEEVRAEMTVSADTRFEQQSIEHQQILSEAYESAEREAKLREEVENNLRITRKAMVQLESRTRKLEMTKNEEMIALEQELDNQIRENSKLESAMEREKQKQSSLEAEMQTASEQLLSARTELRKNTAARAKALASANKAVAFARQAVDARAKSESQLSSIKDRVITQQTTISSLIKALEDEKTSNRDELAFLKAQLDQKSGELESITRGAEAANQTLTTRLVKKVAKPRTVS